MGLICGIHLREPGRLTGLDAMLAALPAGEPAIAGRWTDAATGLGWRGDPELRGYPPERLPCAEPDTRFAVTASVRLDDRSTLCDALEIPHGQRRALPDGALLLRAYARWGSDCPNRVLGDFAFAIWDPRHRTLFCARDPVGTRPLFYSLTADRIVFASDLGAVLAVPGVSDELDETAVRTLLTPDPTPLVKRTSYLAVRRLQPGHTLTVRGASARIERWWRPENAPSVAAGNDDTLAETFLDLLARAVEDRARGARRVGVHLSGGLDSASVAAVAARTMRCAGRPPPLAFSWQPPPGSVAGVAEYRLIEAVRRAAGLEVRYCPPEAADLIAFLRRDGTRDLNITPNEEPVQRDAAQEGVRVLLSGWGGDEGISFNGRGYETELVWKGRLVAAWRSMRERSRRPLVTLLAHAALSILWPDARSVLLRLRAGQRPWRGRGLIHPEFARRVRPLPAVRLPAAGVRRTQLHLLQVGHLAERMDGWATSGARHGIEYGYPLLDRRVLEFALGLPAEQYRRGAASRWLMRQALGPLLPDQVRRHRDKQDPVRFESSRNAVAEALPEVRRLLEVRSIPPQRSVYLDMPHLTAHLDPERYRAGLGDAPLVTSLRFLGF